MTQHKVQLQICILIYSETNASLNEGRNFVKKRKIAMLNEEMNQQAKNILRMKTFKDRCLSTTHKIKSIFLQGQD